MIVTDETGAVIDSDWVNQICDERGWEIRSEEEGDPLAYVVKHPQMLRSYGAVTLQVVSAKTTRISALRRSKAILAERRCPRSRCIRELDLMLRELLEL